MKAKLFGLVWKKGTPPRVLQGVKGNKIPPHAKKGGNGSWVIAGEPTHLYLNVQVPNGDVYENDIYRKVMKVTNRQRMSQKLYEHILEVFRDETFNVDKEGRITWTCKL